MSSIINEQADMMMTAVGDLTSDFYIFFRREKREQRAESFYTFNY